VEHLKEYYKFTTAKAKEFLKKEDGGRRDYLKKYFGKNIDDALLYDLIINTDHVDYEKAARLIADAVLGESKG
jgi:cytidylate kinase